VRLFVEQAFKLIREGRSLDELPSTLPEIYFLHLRLINPQDQNSPHFLDNEAMFKVAKALAKLAVGSDYVPKEFPRQAAAPVLLSIGEPISTQRDPLERLKLNGVLMEKPAGLGPRYRFTLDPIAEFLAAVAYAEEFGSDPDRWQQLVDGAKTAPGYIAALKLVRQAYYSSFFAIG
jgi:hypothetical protein